MVDFETSGDRVGVRVQTPVLRASTAARRSARRPTGRSRSVSVSVFATAREMRVHPRRGSGRPARTPTSGTLRRPKGPPARPASSTTAVMTSRARDIRPGCPARPHRHPLSLVRRRCVKPLTVRAPWPPRAIALWAGVIVVSRRCSRSPSATGSSRRRRRRVRDQHDRLGRTRPSPFPTAAASVRREQWALRATSSRRRSERSTRPAGPGFPRSEDVLATAYHDDSTDDGPGRAAPVL
jgi:hypothetical protein